MLKVKKNCTSRKLLIKINEVHLNVTYMYLMRIECIFATIRNEVVWFFGLV